MSHDETQKKRTDGTTNDEELKRKRAVQIVWVYEYAMAQWWRKQARNDNPVYTQYTSDSKKEAENGKDGTHRVMITIWTTITT